MKTLLAFIIIPLYVFALFSSCWFFLSFFGAHGLDQAFGSVMFSLIIGALSWGTWSYMNE